MTMAELHAQSGNAVANQNHFPGRVVDVYPDRLEILTFDHETRRFDERLRYCDPHSLTELLEWRRGVQGRTYIPVDPETMRQGPAVRDVRVAPGVGSPAGAGGEP